MTVPLFHQVPTQPPRPSVFDDPDNYPGIVLHQPYAGLVRLAGLGYPGKTIETRKSKIRYRGPLIIIAGKQVDYGAWKRIGAELRSQGVPMELFNACVEMRGMAVACFDVSDCRPLTIDDWPAAFFYADGRFAWCSSKVEAIEPFPVHGHQGFMRIPRTAVRAVGAER